MSRHSHPCILCNRRKDLYPQFMYHRFPKDKDKCKKWLRALNLCHIQDKTPEQLHQSYRICSFHFSESNYLNHSITGRLIDKACPDQNLTDAVVLRGSRIYSKPLQTNGRAYLDEGSINVEEESGGEHSSVDIGVFNETFSDFGTLGPELHHAPDLHLTGKALRMRSYYPRLQCDPVQEKTVVISLTGIGNETCLRKSAAKEVAQDFNEIRVQKVPDVIVQETRTNRVTYKSDKEKEVRESFDETSVQQSCDENSVQISTDQSVVPEVANGTSDKRFTKPSMVQESVNANSDQNSTNQLVAEASVSLISDQKSTKQSVVEGSVHANSDQEAPDQSLVPKNINVIFDQKSASQSVMQNDIKIYYDQSWTDQSVVQKRDDTISYQTSTEESSMPNAVKEKTPPLVQSSRGRLSGLHSTTRKNRKKFTTLKRFRKTRSRLLRRIEKLKKAENLFCSNFFNYDCSRSPPTTVEKRRRRRRRRGLTEEETTTRTTTPSAFACDEMYRPSQSTAAEMIGRSHHPCVLCGNTKCTHPESVYHGFPKEKERCNLWRTIISIPHIAEVPVEKLQRNYKICSRHFSPRNYMTGQITSKLKHDACPDQNLQSTRKESDDSSAVLQKLHELEAEDSTMPRGSVCKAKGCTSNKDDNPDLVFHCFPSTRERFDKWADLVQRPDLKGHIHRYMSMKLCSLHFEERMYTTPNKKSRLIWCALPTAVAVDKGTETAATPEPLPVSQTSKRVDWSQSLNQVIVKQERNTDEVDISNPSSPASEASIPPVPDSKEGIIKMQEREGASDCDDYSLFMSPAGMLSCDSDEEADTSKDKNPKQKASMSSAIDNSNDLSCDKSLDTGSEKSVSIPTTTKVDTSRQDVDKNQLTLKRKSLSSKADSCKSNTKGTDTRGSSLVKKEPVHPCELSTELPENSPRQGTTTITATTGQIPPLSSNESSPNKSSDTSLTTNERQPKTPSINATTFKPRQAIAVTSTSQPATSSDSSCKAENSRMKVTKAKPSRFKLRKQQRDEDTDDSTTDASEREDDECDENCKCIVCEVKKSKTLMSTLKSPGKIICRTYSGPVKRQIIKTQNGGKRTLMILNKSSLKTLQEKGFIQPFKKQCRSGSLMTSKAHKPEIDIPANVRDLVEKAEIDTQAINKNVLQREVNVQKIASIDCPTETSIRTLPERPSTKNASTATVATSASSITAFASSNGMPQSGQQVPVVVSWASVNEKDTPTFTFTIQVPSTIHEAGGSTSQTNTFCQITTPAVSLKGPQSGTPSSGSSTVLSDIISRPIMSSTEMPSVSSARKRKIDLDEESSADDPDPYDCPSPRASGLTLDTKESKSKNGGNAVAGFATGPPIVRKGGVKLFQHASNDEKQKVISGPVNSSSRNIRWVAFPQNLPQKTGVKYSTVDGQSTSNEDISVKSGTRLITDQELQQEILKSIEVPVALRSSIAQKVIRRTDSIPKAAVKELKAKYRRLLNKHRQRYHLLLKKYNELEAKYTVVEDAGTPEQVIRDARHYLSEEHILFLESQMFLRNRANRGNRFSKRFMRLMGELYERSPAGYRFLRTVFTIPSVKTVQKWLNQPVEIREEFQRDPLDLEDNVNNSDVITDTVIEVSESQLLDQEANTSYRHKSDRGGSRATIKYNTRTPSEDTDKECSSDNEEESEESELEDGEEEIIHHSKGSKLGNSAVNANQNASEQEIRIEWEEQPWPAEGI